MNSLNLFAPPPSLFLPLSEQSAAQLMAGTGEYLEVFLQTASSPETVALLLLLNLQGVVEKRPSVERIEKIFDSVLRAAMAEAPGVFADIVRDAFDPGVLAQGLSELEMVGVSLLEDHEVKACDYLDANGYWDFTFGRRHRESLQPLTREVTLGTGKTLKMSDQQSRIFDEFKRFRDESFHLQAYAGSGKTYLLAKFVELLNPNTTLLLALFPAQLSALQARIGKVNQQQATHAFTFGHLANLMLNRDLTTNGWRITDRQRARQDYRVSDSQIVHWLNLPSVASLPPYQVADVCRRALSSYCLSPLSTIEARHLPALGGHFSETDIAILVEYSRLMWRETVSPSSPHIRLPIRNTHRIKFLSLTSEVIPEQYTHVIIDESHELSAPILQILDRSPQAVVTLGDEFQQLMGNTRQHSDGVRQRYATQSIRAGKRMGEVLNPLINMHPSSTKEYFEGRAGHPTRVSGVFNMAIPESPTTILVSNEWGLFGWFIRMTQAGARFHVPAMALRDLQTFVKGLDLLYREDIRPRHRLLFRYNYWDALANAMGGSLDFKSAHDWLSQGNTGETFDAQTLRFCLDVSADIKLMKVEDAKNQEFDRVMLASDLMRPPIAGSPQSMASSCALLYTACSRARHELVLPGAMNHWLQDLALPMR